MWVYLVRILMWVDVFICRKSILSGGKVGEERFLSKGFFLLYFFLV